MNAKRRGHFRDPGARWGGIAALSAGRFAVVSIAAGIILWRADIYFWTTLVSVPDGGFAIRLLALLLACGLTIDFLAGLPVLRLPRREDILFVAAADFEARKRLLLAGIVSSAARWPGLPCAAFAVVAALEGLAFATAAKGLAFLLAETLAISGAFLVLVKFGWIPPSRKGYLGRGGSKGGKAGGSFIMRVTAAGLRPTVLRLPDPYRWLAARELLAALRREPVSAALYGALLIALGTQFLLWDRLAPLIAFTLTACMLTLTLFRTLTDQSRAYADACPYLFPPPWIRHRCDAAMMLFFSGVFLAYFLAAARHHLDSAAAWQCAATLIAFAMLQTGDVTGREPRPGSRMIRNFCYLGLAGALFMFPLWGMAAAMAAGLFAAGRFFRHALPPGSSPAAVPNR